MTLAEAVLAVMLQLSPESRWTALPGHEESASDRRARYASIAADLAAVAPDAGDAARLLAVAWHESGFAHDVDVGRCYRGPGYEKRCDAGRAVCLIQAQPPRRQRELLRTDRRACLAFGLAAIKRSLATCARNSPEHRFAGLSGSCSRGLAGSRRIHALVRRTDSGLRLAIAPKDPS
jgi:hypothetical protein